MSDSVQHAENLFSRIRNIIPLDVDESESDDEFGMEEVDDDDKAADDDDDSCMNDTVNTRTCTHYIYES